MSTAIPSPIYIVSKGRWETLHTSRALQWMGVEHNIVVEEQERERYTQAVGPLTRVLVLDRQYQRDYETCDDFGDTKSKGPGPARNFAWEHSIAEGHRWHWVMDDNILGFMRFNKNRQLYVKSPSILRVMEDFCLRYTNVLMAGPNYFMFVPRKVKVLPFSPNTRIYSCNLIRNDAPYRWRGRYNEDTDLSLRMLKDGHCTIQFNAFLQHKLNTQVVKGGNTAEFYAKEGTLPKSAMLMRLHPDVAVVRQRFGRVHHYVNYLPFRANKLIRDQSVPLPADPEYGMRVGKVDTSAAARSTKKR